MVSSRALFRVLLHILHLYLRRFDFFLRVWLVMLIVPFFTALLSLSWILVLSGSVVGAPSRSVSSSYLVVSGIGSPGRLEVGGGVERLDCALIHSSEGPLWSGLMFFTYTFLFLIGDTGAGSLYSTLALACLGCRVVLDRVGRGRSLD